MRSGEWERLIITALAMFFLSRDKSLFWTKLGNFEGALTLGPRRYRIKLMLTHLLKLPKRVRD